jgi:hypothetical protein
MKYVRGRKGKFDGVTQLILIWEKLAFPLMIHANNLKMIFFGLKINNLFDHIHIY